MFQTYIILLFVLKEIKKCSLMMKIKHFYTVGWEQLVCKSVTCTILMLHVQYIIIYCKFTNLSGTKLLRTLDNLMFARFLF